MSPATAQKPRPKEHSVVKGTREMFEGAKTLKGAQAPHEHGKTETRSLEEMLTEQRIKRLESFVRKLRPEEQAEVSHFMEKLLKWADHHKQQGASPYWLEEHAEAYLTDFCKSIWKDSPYNKKRVQIMMRFLRANAVLPEDRPVSR